ncbi:unnamed protein product [Bursaphelenchus okinawaensis]|uniref:Uncharacterized protein n=1 Tax=Bursaphelenchus okinawaensis TaxID=465554 RepID=A0A811LGQ0_9BILA|nr:unnamed protein product [Bursaphelenchus okinawaensis]CAG9122065.1 unnamed protein product [Bursaphelenchus okinawaensis]
MRSWDANADSAVVGRSRPTKALTDMSTDPEQFLKIRSGCAAARYSEGPWFDPAPAQPRRLMEWIVLYSCRPSIDVSSARGLGTSILGLHEYMIERQKSYGAPHLRHSDARNSGIPGERPNYRKHQTQG